MPELLIVWKNQSDSKTLTTLAKEREIRVKNTLSIDKALSWIRLRRFELLLLDTGLPLEAQEAVSKAFSEKNPKSECILYCLSGELPPRGDLLPGAQLFFGQTGLVGLSEKLTHLQPILDSSIRNSGILVVEDLESPRDIICSYIESKGYPFVKGCASATEALECLRTHPGKFACVVSDIRMPDMGGLELVQTIRGDKNLEHLPIIMLTAYGSVDALLDCLAAGASGFLVKPPKMKDLQSELTKAFKMVEEKADPRLISTENIETLRERLIQRGFS